MRAAVQGRNANFHAGQWTDFFVKQSDKTFAIRRLFDCAAWGVCSLMSLKPHFLAIDCALSLKKLVCSSEVMFFVCS